MRFRGFTIILAMCLVAVLAGCGSDDGAATDPDAPTTGPLDGATYVVTSATESGEPHEFVEGSEVRLTFGGGRLGIQAGCNTMSGAYTVDGDRLDVEPLASTEMACDQALMDQDAWLAGFFSETIRFEHDDETMTLTGSRTVLELTDREVVSPDAALTDTDWSLESIVEDTGPDGAVSSLPDGTAATLRINGDGSTDVDTGCNSGFTTAEVGTDTVTFGPLVLTRKACLDDAATEVEQAVVTLLEGEVDFEITEQQLTLTKDGRALQWRVAD